MKDFSIRVFTFGELSPDLLYRLLQLRTEVFLMEQGIVCQDMDDLDREALHFLALAPDGTLLSYCRLIPPHEGAPYVKFGRFVTAAASRKAGVGSAVLDAALAFAADAFPDMEFRLSGQLYLESYYAKRGLKPVTEAYLEEGIPHKLFIKI